MFDSLPLIANACSIAVSTLWDAVVLLAIITAAFSASLNQYAIATHHVYSNTASYLPLRYRKGISQSWDEHDILRII